MKMKGIGIAFLLLLLSFIFSMDSYARETIGAELCQYDGFTCHRVKRHESWYTLFPNDHDRDIVMRINRTNTRLYAGLVIAVPDNLEESDIMDFSPFPQTVSRPGEKVILIDTSLGAWGAYDAEGNLVRWGPASGGREWCNDIDAPCETHDGAFRIFSLGSSGCISHKFPLPDGGAPMPYCMYFNNGQALHGEPDGLPGYNASHGCVRLYVNDAEWLRYDFVEGPNPSNHYRGTKVIVRSF